MPPKLVNTRHEQLQGTSGLHARLHGVVTGNVSYGNGTTEQTSDEFRRIAIEETGGIGAFHFTRDRTGQETIAKDHITGRVPMTPEIQEQLCKTARTSLERERSQIQPLSKLDNVFIVCCPVNTSRAPFSVLGVLVPSDAGFLQAAAFIVEVIASYNRLWINSQWTGDLNWQLQTTAALCELTTRTLSQPNRHIAGLYLVNELKRLIDTNTVALALISRGTPHLIAISGQAVLDKRNEQVRVLLNTLRITCHQRSDTVTLKSANEQALHHRHAHSLFDHECVRSFPLQTPTGETIGALYLSGQQNTLASTQTTRLLKAATPHLALALQAVQQKEPPLSIKLANSTGKFIASNSGIASVLACLLVFGLLMVHVPYRVQCRAIVEPESRRYVVAPLNAMLEQCFVKPGDLVQANTILAQLDGRELRGELASVIADRNKAAKQRDIELSNNDVSKAVLASLEEEGLAIQEMLLRHQLSQLQIMSPLEGIVLSAEYAQEQNIPLEKGTVLFEIAPADQHKLHVLLPSEEVASVQVGNSVSLWLDGLGGQQHTGRISSIRPQSEQFEGRNVFVAELILETHLSGLRPGMQGYARITGEAHALGWNLFHKPWEWCISHLSW